MHDVCKQQPHKVRPTVNMFTHKNLEETCWIIPGPKPAFMQEAVNKTYVSSKVVFLNGTGTPQNPFPLIHKKSFAKHNFLATTFS